MIAVDRLTMQISFHYVNKSIFYNNCKILGRLIFVQKLKEPEAGVRCSTHSPVVKEGHAIDTLLRC